MRRGAYGGMSRNTIIIEKPLGLGYILRICPEGR
jgi:hypothetical protein